MSLSRLHRFVGCLLAVAVSSVASSARATIFFTDSFAYADGQLTAHNGGADVSGGLWTTHSPTPAQTPTTGTVQVLGGEAVIKAGLAEDVSRSTLEVLPEGGSWYYAARFKATAPTGALAASNYFMHFKDEGTVSFRSRLYITTPNVANPEKFSFGLSAGSLSSGPLGNGALVPWTAEDYSYNTDIVVVAKYTSADGLAETPDEGFGQLWVNPVNSASTSIIDSNPNPNNLTDDAMSRLALRQGAAAGQPDILVNVVSIGTTFEEVLAAVSLAAPANNADFNNDNVVDGDDFLIWQRGFGLTGQTGKTNGNANADTVVDGLDFNAWKAKFGGPPAVAAGSAVPEPGTLALAALTLAALGAARRRA